MRGKHTYFHNCGSLLFFVAHSQVMLKYFNGLNPFYFKSNYLKIIILKNKNINKLKNLIMFLRFPLSLLFAGCISLLLNETLPAQTAADNVKMKSFIDGLMKKMTLEEKIGQLNLPGSGDIVTGEAKSSDIGRKIREGKVGGLFNIKSVAKIRDIQRVAVEESRLKIPLLFGDGFDVEQTTDFALADFASNVRAFCFAGYNVAAAGQIELSDFLF
jgi:hypothetical protein